MGYQIPGCPTMGKAQYLMDTYGAKLLPGPPAFYGEIPDDQAIICVINTITYETASYAFSTFEFSILNDTSDFRKRTWLLMDKAQVNQMTGFGKVETP